MTHQEVIVYLLDYFISETPENQNITIPEEEEAQKQLLRGLMNQRPPSPVPSMILNLQDNYLEIELSGREVFFSSLKSVQPNIYLWQGDITTLATDGIVNAGNSDLLGCFHPCHGCIDNAIHSFAGIQLRLACQELMEKQGRPEMVGLAKITPAFNLPSKYVLHTVGPRVEGKLEEYHYTGLQSCYQSCLELAVEQGLHSLAFCCISTGEFRFPNDIACGIAVNTVTSFLKKHPNSLNVVFNVFTDQDYALYQQQLC